MAAHRHDNRLGLLVLVALMAPQLAPQLAPRRPPPVLPWPELAPRTEVAFGLPVAPDEADPEVWQELSGIGSTRARRIAELAAGGDLRRPDDLLRVHGVGPTLRDEVAPRVAWGVQDGSPP
jgi:hypothetical protein